MCDVEFISIFEYRRKKEMHSQTIYVNTVPRCTSCVHFSHVAVLKPTSIQAAATQGKSVGTGHGSKVGLTSVILYTGAGSQWHQ